ncbi:MAG: DUF4175 family protein [Candidatus Brocadiia bacterium]
MDTLMESGSGATRWREAGGALLGRLGDFGRRVRSLALMAALLWAGAVALGALLAVAYVDLLVALPPVARLLGVAGAGMLGIFALCWTVLTARGRARAASMARQVDRVAETGGQVTAALDLTELSYGTSDLTLALAGMALEQARRIVYPIPEERIAPLRQVGRAGGALAGVALLILTVGALANRAFDTELARLFDPWGDHPRYSRHVFEVEPGDTEVVYADSLTIRARIGGPPAEHVGLVVASADGTRETLPLFGERGQSWRVQLTDVTDPLTYWVTTRDGRSRRYSVGVVYTPRIESLVVRVTPPDYTNLPPREGQMPEGGISGLSGTRVALTLRSNRPLSAAKLRLKLEDGSDRTLDGEPLAEDPRTATARFTVRQKGQLELWAEDEQGRRSSTSVTAPIFVLEDHAPTVKITSPRQRSFSTPDVTLPVRVAADDDYGISALSLYRSLNGSRHLPENLMVPLPMERRLTRDTALPLLRYGLQPGDVICLFARVEDSAPSGPKGSESAVTRITIISRELYERLMRTRREVAAFQQKYREAARRLEDLREKTRELGETVAAGEEPDASKALREGLKELAQELSRAAEKTEQAAEQRRYALDRDLSEPLKDLARRLRSVEQAARRGADSPDDAAMREALARAARALEQSGGEYEQKVTQPLADFTRAFDLLEMQARFVELAERQGDLVERMAELRGRDLVREPRLVARMRDLRAEQEARAQELTAVLQGIRDRAMLLPESTEFDELRRSAQEFAEAVQQSRASEAMEEAAASLQQRRGTDALARAAEAAQVLESFIGRCSSQAGSSARRCKLAFGPKRSESAAQTARQMLQSLGLQAQLGGQIGLGSGTGGYSMRAATMDNVGIYGSQPWAAGAGMDDEERPFGGVSAEAKGGQGGDPGVVTSPESLQYDAQMLGSIAPRRRAHVRAYLQRVADELAAGRILSAPTRSPTHEGEERER